jgi:CheY-like chemotaxis protein
MPEMDGMTAAAWIRDRLADRERPYIVALTANAMAAERLHYLNSGMDSYLSKPIDVDTLTSVLKDAACFRRTNRSGVPVGAPPAGGGKANA